jgi:malonyl CoA-acyl carrier protein transacylase
MSANPSAREPIAIVGLGCVLPDAPDVETFWNNLTSGKNSIREVPKERWDPALYWDADKSVPDKTYAKIGGFVMDDAFDGIAYRMPPKVVEQVDPCQRWALSATRQALVDARYATGLKGDEGRDFDRDRCAVILGNAMGGESNKIVTKRLFWPEAKQAMLDDEDFQTLSTERQNAMLERAEVRYKSTTLPVTEDTMPGHLSNVIAGRIANAFNLAGKNFTTDAACASSLAALDAAVDTLRDRDADMVVWGGSDRSMDITPYVQFSKIGALSPDGSRPFDKDANGFVMGEGCAMFVLKLLADAERDGDTVYATVIGVGSSSDGKGKGITAPNPAGQVKAVLRAYRDAGIDPATIGYLEAHGTSTPVGDPVELESVQNAFVELSPNPPAVGSIRVGSVKGNIGHLKAGAGAAGVLKAILAIHRQQIPPSINVRELNPRIDWGTSPFKVNTELTPWTGDQRRAAVSSFGFGGTNFHVIFEQHLPGKYVVTGTGLGPAQPSMASVLDLRTFQAHMESAAVLEGDAVVLAADEALKAAVLAAPTFTQTGEGPRLRNLLEPFTSRGVNADERVAFHVENVEDIAKKLELAEKAMANPAAAKLAYNQGVFLGRGKPEGKVAFLFPGQGTQYVNMGRDLAQKYEVVRNTFEEADAALIDELGGVKLTDILWPSPDTPENRKASEEKLRLTEYTQPAVLAMDAAVLRLLNQWGIEPDMVAGHSLGEYGALVAAGVLTLQDALHAVAARGREMANVDLPDLGKMASVSADWQQVTDAIAGVDGYVICANKNCPSQTVIAGSTEGVDNALVKLKELGLHTMELPVSAAFHSEIVAPASEPLRRVIARLGVNAPKIRVLSNVGAADYQDDPEWILDNLAIQVASPVAWTDIIDRMYADGVRTFIEVGPKRALTGFVADILKDKTDIRPIFSNHPKQGGIASMNTLFAFLGANGFNPRLPALDDHAVYTAEFRAPTANFQTMDAGSSPTPPAPSSASGGDRFDAITAQLTAIANEVQQMRTGSPASATVTAARPSSSAAPISIGVSGISVGLPGRHKPFFSPDNWDRILRGENLIDVLDADDRQAMVDKHITRLVKSAGGQGTFEGIDDPSQVIKLAGRRGAFDLKEWGVSDDLLETLDVTSQYAIAAGLEALHDAGIPLQRTYKETSTGSKLPQGWALPKSIGDRTGIIFASAFPGYDALMQELKKAGNAEAFNRKFLFHILSMGHSQLAQFLGARGPNTQVNAACASTTQAISIAEDWIKADRCDRVIVVGADDATSPNMMEWIGSGFLASGAATTEENVEEAALPFDARRHGMIIGMGAVGLVVERTNATEERGMRPIANLLATQVSNSAFHGSRLDIDHIASEMQELLRRAGVDPRAIADQTVFMSHETYTPARGGSAAAEIHALRAAFGDGANKVVIANTKGFTGHPQGAGIEDGVVLKCLQRSTVPPIPHLKEPDPELGDLNLSKGGTYNLRYGLRLAAGFGSQVAMTLTELVAKENERFANQNRYNAWLSEVTGIDGATIEVVDRTYRIVDNGAPTTEVVKPKPEPVAQESAPIATSESNETLVKVIAVVADKTGYPTDLLEPDLDMEADLGIDTVKQAELFGELRDHFGVPLDESLQLKDYNTLRKVANYMAGGESVAAEPTQTLVAAQIATPATPAVSAPVAVASNEALERVTAAVAEKTGYPPELLEPDLDMEADLGIDTVKQAELFGELREMFGVPLDESLQLSEFNTLRKVAAYMGGGNVTSAPEHAVAEAAPTTSTQAIKVEAPVEASDDVLAKVTAVVAEKTGYPVELLEPDLDMEADLGIDTVKQAELFGELRDHFGVPLDESLQLSDYATLRKVAAYMGKGNAPMVETNSETAIETETKTPAIVEIVRRIPTLHPTPLPDEDNGISTDGIVLLIGQEPHPSFVEAWEEAGFTIRKELHEGVKLRGVVAMMTRPGEGDAHSQVGELFDATKALASQLIKGTFMATVTAQDGAHGLQTPRDGAMAAAAGFTKAIRKELPECLVKAIDIHPDDRDAAEQVVAEVLRGGMRTEVCYSQDGARSVIDVAPAELPDAIPDVAGKTFVVPGGAQGITAEILQTLAPQGPNFVLIGRTPLPGDAAVWAGYGDVAWKNQESIAIAAIKADGDKPTPVSVKKRMDPMRKAAAMHQTIADLVNAGAQVMYDAVDVTDRKGVAAVVAAAREKFGSIDGIIHAAGVEISKAIADKPREQFDLVFGIKAGGLDALLRATKDDDLQWLVCFGSVAGRFGNIGQADYSAVNELLAKETKRVAAERGIATAFTIAWGPWGEVGMATRGGIMTVLEQSGVTPIPTAEGIAHFTREMACPGIRESVVAGTLGGLDIDGQIVDAAWDPAIGEANSWLQTNPEGFRLIHAVDAVEPGQSLRATVRLDRVTDPYLMDHAIDGVPLLPGVFGIESFAEAARLLVDDDFVLHGAENIRFVSPLKQHKDAVVDAILEAKLLDRDGDTRRIGCTLSTQFIGPDGKPLGEPRLHFEGTVRFGVRLDGLRTGQIPDTNKSIKQSAIYPPFFHGSTFQVLQAVGPLADESTGAMRMPKGAWFGAGHASFMSHPLVTEALFQLCGLRTMHTDGVMSLPASIARIDTFPGDSDGEIRLWCEAKGTDDNGNRLFDGAACTMDGNVIVRFSGYGMVETGPIEVASSKPDKPAEAATAAIPVSAQPQALQLPTIEGVIFHAEPVVAGAKPDSKWFAADDADTHGAFNVPKRAAEWLAGRLAVKRAVCFADESISPLDVQVATDDHGAPSLIIKGKPSPVHVSITHRDGYAIAALSESHLGIDLETIEDRADSWWQQSFSKSERRAMRGMEDANAAATCAWAAKEACLKRHGTGLEVSLHKVTVKADGEGGASVNGPFGTWGVRFFEVDGRVLAVTVPTFDTVTAET